MSNQKHFSRLFAASALATIMGLWSASAQAVFVDCSTGGSIQTQLNGGETFVQFSGVCNEFVTVSRTGTVVEGTSPDRSLDVITFGVSVFSVTQVRIQSLTIRGSGVFVFEGAYARFVDVAVDDTDAGVLIFRHSGAQFVDCDLGAALDDDPNTGGGGLAAFASAFAQLQSTTVRGDTSTPGLNVVQAIRNSSIEIRGGNVITNDGSNPTVGAIENSSIRQDNPTGRGTDVIVGGAVAQDMGLLDIREANVTGPVLVQTNSQLMLGSTVFGGDPALLQIDGNIQIEQDSALVVRTPLVTINGDVTCADDESSLSTDTFAGTHTIACTDFNAGKLKGKK